MSEESLLLSPDEVTRIKRKRETQVDMNANKFANRAGQVQVNFESKGRFSIPESMWFSDFTVENINNFTLSSLEDIMEQVVIALETIKNQDCSVPVSEMTLEEFFETLIAIKLSFNTKNHVHRWFCECQNEEVDKQINETIIDLTTIQYKSIEEVDNIFKKSYVEYFETLSDEQFKEYVINKYGEERSVTKQDELDAFEVKEPFFYKDPTTGNKYGFRLIRVKDVINSTKLAKKVFSSKIAKIERRPNPHGVPLAEIKAQKEADIEELKKEEAKLALLYIRALTLVSYNDKDIIDFNEQERLYRDIKREAFFQILDFLTAIDFGVVDEREYECKFCGKTERRSLQQDSTPLEFLPLESHNAREQRKHVAANFYFGV